MADISKIARLVNGVSRNIDTSTNTLVVDNLKIKLGGANFVTFSGSLSAVRTIAMPDANVNLGHIADLSTLSGVAAGSTDLGTFTGGTIPANQTTKGALQALETALGSVAADETFIDSTFRIQDDLDQTKALAFEVGGLTTSTTRTITMPDANVDLGLISTAIQSSEKASANGVATLDGGGKIPASQLPSTVMELQGTWDASTNTPTLANGLGDPGDVYEVIAEGTVDFGAGPIAFAIGDWAVYGADGLWYKSINSNEVTSVNGYLGTVELTTDDIPEGFTNQYFNDKTSDDLPEGITNLYHSQARVLGTILDGLNLSSTNNVGQSDSILDAIGKLQAQISNLVTDSTVKTMIVGEPLAAHTSYLVRMAVSGETAGNIYIANNAAGAEGSETNHYYVIGMVTTGDDAVSATQAVQVTLVGQKAIGFAVTPFAAADFGKPVFLGTGGSLTTVAPSGPNIAIVRVGTVMGASSVMIQGIQLLGIDG